MTEATNETVLHADEKAPVVQGASSSSTIGAQLSFAAISHLLEETHRSGRETFFTVGGIRVHIQKLG